MFRKIFIMICVVSLALWYFGGVARAAVFNKANNTSNLTQGSSWVGGLAPGIGDTATWDSTVNAANSTSLGGTFYVNNIAIANPGGPVTINNDGNVLGLYGLGGTGIDMSGATQDLTMNCMVGLGSTQTWNVGPDRNLNFQGTLNGGYGIVIAGGGTVTLGGNNGYTGGTTVASGTLKAYGWGNIFGPDGSLVKIQSGATLDLNGSDSFYAHSYSISVSGSGVDGNGAIIDKYDNIVGFYGMGLMNITLMGDVTLGSVIVNGSIIGNQHNLTKVGSGLLATNGAITAVNNIYVSAGTFILNGLATGVKNVYIGGSTLKLAGTIDDSQAGSIYVNTGGILSVEGGFGQSQIQKSIVMAGGVFQATYGIPIIAGNISLNSIGNFSPWGYTALILNGTISDGTTLNGINVSGGGTLIFGGANTYSGDTTVSFGTLKLGSNSAIPGGPGKGNVNLGMGSVLDVYGKSASINGLSGYGIIDNTSGNGILSIGSNNATSTFYGAIQNTVGILSVVKQGSGTQTLAGANIYKGDTIINGGTLEIAGGIDPSGTSLINVQSGTAVLKTVNVNKTNLNINNASLATFEVVDGTHTVGAITGSGITQTDASASLTVASIFQDMLSMGSGATLTIQPIPGGLQGNTITPVPEPSALVLLSCALILALSIWSKKQKF
jgi:fibronectin-binding autotransporter adhesin